ncbi:MAG: DUF3078 domain-containing protein [Alphaproteobacteria bacterium]|nr:DUF3078 domain-containing protein [Alphaproteobacteria bacterium]
MKTLFKSLLLGVAFVPALALAEETAPTWQLDVREISLSYSNTTVGNAREYSDSPISAYSADSQYNIVGKLDAFLNRSDEKSFWSNNLMLNYGKLKIKPVDEEEETSESADKIWLSTDYALKLWKYKDADIGPFAQLAFQTEFTANQDSPRYKAFSGREGLKLFEGKFVKDLYLAAMQEYDFTYSDKKTMKHGWEIGLRAEYPIREGVKLSGSAKYTDYVHFSEFVPTDLRYDLDLTAKMEVALTDTLAFAPYVSYRRGQARGTDKVGTNLMVGLQLKYADLFDL